jgi:hypothetical protein
MTREEQIRQASIEYTYQKQPMCIGGGVFSEMVDEMNRNHAFEEGAKWADKTIIDNACAWLKSKLNYVENRIGEPVVCSFDYETIDEFITAFRQAMKGGAE